MAMTRWGILGTGSIAHKFAGGLLSARNGELVAVGSRTQESADAFGEEFAIPRRHGSYEALAADSDVDAVYISSPHPMHKANSLLCLRGGKAVLCEKPFAVNQRDAREVAEFARANGLFCMEAMWTRFLPALVRMREILAEGTIGDVRMVLADFSFRCGWNPEGRLLNPQLAGGGLLDVGVYCVSLASMVLGEPSQVTSLAHLGETGVDEHSGVLFGYEGGELAVLVSGVRTMTPMEATICGTEGRIRLHHPWWKCDRLTLTVGGSDETLDLPFEGNGYNYEAEEVGRCLAAGKTESDVMPLDETLRVVGLMDKIRDLWGLKYPME